MDLKKAAVYTLLFYFLVSGIIQVIAQTAGLMNAMGWGIVSLHVVFIIWFGYYAIKN